MNTRPLQLILSTPFLLCPGLKAAQFVTLKFAAFFWVSVTLHRFLSACNNLSALFLCILSHYLSYHISLFIPTQAMMSHFRFHSEGHSKPWPYSFQLHCVSLHFNYVLLELDNPSSYPTSKILCLNLLLSN